MKSFKDLGIQPTSNQFTGDKIRIDRIFNREIVVKGFKIEESKFKEKGSGMRLCLQIKVGESEHIVFTGSTILMDTIKKVPPEAFPFTTTIVKENECFKFT